MSESLSQNQPKAEMLNLFAHRGIDFVSGNKATLVDSHGKTYTDLAAGHGVAAIGHAHPAVQRALAEQGGRLLCCPGSFGNPQRQALVETLSRLTPAGLTRFFFTNSGTESVEAALKMAILSSPRQKLIAFRGSFHGRTLGALGLTYNPKYRQPFAGFTPQATFLPYNDLNAAETAIDETVCAVILEPIQGEGGVVPGSRPFLRGIEALCRRHGCLLILDEVQTGGGRTGSFWALEDSGLSPDILCFAKALGGGFPFGGIACSPRITETPGSHGSTYGGNPLACATALAAIGVIHEEKLCEAAHTKGKMMIKTLEGASLPGVREIRGRGMMIGIELNQNVNPLLVRLQERGVIALAAGPRVLRLLPPLTIPEEQLMAALNILVEELGNMGKS
jgi:acetylornithine/LysW-gamma-L-lysine aminotransferase